MIEAKIETLVSFRKFIHAIIPSYRDATMDLIDALSTNKNATSVIQLSENSFFRRQYQSITKVINHFLVPNKSADDEDANAPKTTGKEKVNQDLRPCEKLQGAIRNNIASLCSFPAKRDFFCSRVTSHQP